MCNRYTLHDREAALEAIAHALKHGLEAPDWTFNPRYNIGPGTIVPVVTAAGGDSPGQVRAMVWGLIPFYSRDKPSAPAITNATAEKARSSPLFRQATAKRRCLLPANGYYEWQAVGALKLPHLFTLRDGAPFAFAGIWEPASATRPATVALLTTQPNRIAAAVHNRMPVVLPAERMPRWLGAGPEPLPDSEFEALTAPLPDEWLAERPVSRFVSNSRHEGPQCLAPPDAPAADPQLSLF